jgi:hypothetical protein
MSDDEVAVAAVRSLETSRRVGWAKAYENESRAGSLEQQVSALQSELTALRSAYVRLIGLASALVPAGQAAGRDEIRRHRQAAASFWDKDAYKQGRNLGIRAATRAARGAAGTMQMIPEDELSGGAG